jgi:hypothetical protein
MNRVVVAAALAAFAVVTYAQTSPGYSTFTFVTVDAVRHENSGYLYITGLQEGAVAAAEERINFSWTNGREQCLQLALIAMSKPGQYRLSMYGSRSGTVTPLLYARDCRLERAAP